MAEASNMEALDALKKHEEEMTRRDAETETHAKDIANRKTEIAVRQEQIVKLLEEHKLALDTQIGRNRELVEREKKLAVDEENIAAARAKIAEEAKRLIERERQLLASEQGVKAASAATMPGPMPAGAKPVAAGPVSPP